MPDQVTQSQITLGLAELGAKADCHIMVHASLSRFGQVSGGAFAVVAALRETAGAGGAVIVPSFRDAIRSDHFALRECADSCPSSLCPSRESGFTGIIGETVREQSDALRSCHPTHSWVGFGAGAEFLLSGHGRSATPCGHDSPFFRLMQRDGIVLLLGVGAGSLTNLHAVEDARYVQYLSAIEPLRRHATYTTSGRRIQYKYGDLLQDACVTAGILRTRRIGAANCHLLRARDLGSFLWVVTEDDPWCLVLRPSRGAYDPEADAKLKTTRMVKVWNANRDLSAWERLLEASRRPRQPVHFAPTAEPRTGCPAYRGRVRDQHRCAANDLPPWEKFSDYPPDEPGVATCDQCNWPPSTPCPK